MSSRFPEIDDLRRMAPLERAKFRAVLLNQFTFFVEYVFWLRERSKYYWTPLHRIIAYTLRKVDTGEYTRVLINAPPRMGKSEMVTKFWPAWHFIREPRCNFIEQSYSKDLIQDMSAAIREILECAEITYLFGTSLKEDTTAKGLWKTPEGGGLRAAPTKGQITGFGAGRLGWDKFAGAIIISDPVKPADAKSLPIMETVNNMFNSTTKNRINDKRTPIIIEAQRLVDNDLSGFVLGGGSGKRWLHVRIPFKIDVDDMESAELRYETDWNYGDPVELKLPQGYIWDMKYGEKEDEELSVTPDIKNAQFYQNPRITAGAFFLADWFGRYDSVDVDSGFNGTVTRCGETINIKQLSIFSDTAQKTKEVNDWTVFQLWGLGEDNWIYLINQLRGKWEAPDLETEALRFMHRYADRVPRRYGWRDINIEDKSSGTGLIQQLKRSVYAGRVNPIPRNIDKVSRALDCVLPIHSGHVWIPKHAPWVTTYLDEFTKFSKYMTHKHDDQMDATFDAINTMLPKGASIFDCV